MNILAILLVFGVLTLLYGFVLAHFGMKRLEITRKFSRPAVFEGERGEMIETVSKYSPLPVPWLRVESRIPGGLQLGKMENLDLNGGMYYQSIFTVLPRQRIVRRHFVRFAHRGVYNVGNAALTCGGVSGLNSHSRDQDLNASVVVWPRLLDEDALPQPVARTIGEWLLRRHLSEDPFTTCGIRAYRDGDPVRDIHWPATARTGEAQVRVHENTAAVRLLVILNAQLTEGQWAQLMDYQQGPVEYGISVAATLCVKALRGGMAAGFAANLKDGERDDFGVYSPPAAGAAREEEILSMMAKMRIVQTLGFETFLSRMEIPRGTDVLILTGYETDDMRAHFRRLRMSGCTVTVHDYTKGG